MEGGGATHSRSQRWRSSKAGNHLRTRPLSQWLSRLYSFKGSVWPLVFFFSPTFTKPVMPPSFEVDLHVRLLKHGVRNAWVINPSELTNRQRLVRAAQQHGLEVHRFHYPEEKEPGAILYTNENSRRPVLRATMTTKEVGRLLGYPLACTRKDFWKQRFMFSIMAQRTKVVTKGTRRVTTRVGRPVYVTSFQCDSLSKGFEYFTSFTSKIEAVVDHFRDVEFQFSFFSW